MAPLPPPFPNVSQRFPGAEPECLRLTHRCCQHSWPAGAPGTAKNMLARRVRVSGGQKGGKGVLHSPASLPFHPSSPHAERS